MNAQLKEEDFVSEDRLSRVESELKELRTGLHEFKIFVTAKFGEMNAAFEKLRGELNTGLANNKLWMVLAAGSMIVSAISIFAKIFKLI